VAERLRQGEAFIKSLTNSSSLTIAVGAARPSDSAVAILSDAEVVLPLEGLIDKQAECAKLRKARADLDRQIDSLRAKLGNEAFVSRAPADVVEGQRSKLTELETQRAAVSALIEKDCGG
jgi:valyl-tRNA synthetase